MKTVKKLLAVLMSVLLLLLIGSTALAADETKIETLDNSAIDNTMWMIAGGEDELYYEYGYVILTGKRAGSAVVTVTDPGSGAACSVKVTVLPQYLQSVMSLLVTLQTILANLRIALFSLFGG